MKSDRLPRRASLVLAGMAAAGLCPPSFSFAQMFTLEDAQGKASALTAKAAEKAKPAAPVLANAQGAEYFCDDNPPPGWSESAAMRTEDPDAPAARRAPVSVDKGFATAMGAPKQCSCAQWSDASSWTTTKCTDCRTWDRGPRQGQSKCYGWSKYRYDVSYCQNWKQDFCNDTTASVGAVPARAGVLSGASQRERQRERKRAKRTRRSAKSVHEDLLRLYCPMKTNGYAAAIAGPANVRKRQRRTVRSMQRGSEVAAKCGASTSTPPTAPSGWMWKRTIALPDGTGP